LWGRGPGVLRPLPPHTPSPNPFRKGVEGERGSGIPPKLLLMVYQ